MQNAISGNVGGMGFLSTLSTAQLQAIASALARATPTSSLNYTGMWWKPTESGWGINVNHQGDIVFATLFTYDERGAPLWVMMTGLLQADGRTYAGDLYRVSGPAFNAQPFTPITAANLFKVGTMALTFSSASTATLSYTYQGVVVSKDIVPQVFGTAAASCSATTGSRAGLTNYQDMWWNPAESGWGVNIVHQNSTLFATLMTYDLAGSNLWLVMSAGLPQSDGSYLGDLYRVNGPAFNAQPFTPITGANLAQVGTMRFTFTDGITGTLAYTVNGVPVSKSITRQVFATPVPACSSPVQPLVNQPVDGPTLYANHCAACHGSLASSTKGNATLTRTQSAIASNVGGMGSLSTLSTIQLQAIVSALASVAPPTPPVTTDGPTLYANHCAACHGALASSTKGGATLTRTQSAIGGNVGGMGSLSTLSTIQLQAIVSALASVAPPTPPVTTDGPTLYANHCAACHGALASSTKGGATLTRTQSAIGGNVGGMGSLSTLSTIQLQAIVSALASVAPPTPPVTTDGPTLYANHCAACHGALASSTKGGATLTRTQSAIGGNVGGMGSLSTLSTIQLQAIVSALASVAPAPSPTCGSCHGLPPRTGEHGEHKSRSCSTCHGAGYSSTTVNPVTHNNGIKDLVATIGWSATSRNCTNSCHGKQSW